MPFDKPEKYIQGGTQLSCGIAVYDKYILYYTGQNIYKMDKDGKNTTLLWSVNKTNIMFFDNILNTNSMFFITTTSSDQSLSLEETIRYHTDAASLLQKKHL